MEATSTRQCVQKEWENCDAASCAEPLAPACERHSSDESHSEPLLGRGSQPPIGASPRHVGGDGIPRPLVVISSFMRFHLYFLFRISVFAGLHGRMRDWLPTQGCSDYASGFLLDTMPLF